MIVWWVTAGNLQSTVELYVCDQKKRTSLQRTEPISTLHTCVSTVNNAFLKHYSIIIPRLVDSSSLILLGNNFYLELGTFLHQVPSAQLLHIHVSVAQAHLK